ncbi:MAG: HD domain-containing phosphohydrolase [Syntrophus sp. (in: bacteria)]
MHDPSRTNKELIEEITLLNQRIQELEQTDSERKQTEETSKESEAKFKLFIDHAIEALYLHEMSGEIIDVNETAVNDSGYSREELLQLTAFDIDPTLYNYKNRSEIWKQLAPFQYQTFYANHRRKSGSLYPIEVKVGKILLDGKEYMLSLAHDITDRKNTEEKLHQILDNLQRAFNATIQVMVSAVEIRDPYTAGHQIRMADLARAIATEMGLSQIKIDSISMAGSIHDIGKLSIPAEILTKPAKLSEIEILLVKEHAQKGYEMLKDVESPWPLADMVYQHHERMDGSGYPRNLKGEEIIIESRILAVADVVESMSSHRPYCQAVGLNAALEEIENNKGTLYDADAVDACLSLFRGKGFRFAVT